MDFVTWCENNNIDPAGLSDAVKTQLQAQWRLSLRDAEGGTATMTAPADDIGGLYDAAIAANPHTAGALAAARDRTILTGIDRKAAELDVMRTSRSQGPNTIIPAGRGGMADVMEARVLAGLGMPDRTIAKHYGDRAADAASGSGRTMGLHDLFRAQLRAVGRHVPTGRLTAADIGDALRFSAMAGSGLSTIDVSGILSNVANKLLLESFSGTMVTWNKFCRVSANSDFKGSKRFRMTGIGTFIEVPPGGELKHISLSESETSAQLSTYGAIIGLDRRDLINDDLAALATIPRALGRMSALKIEKSVFTIILANAGDFFGVSNANYASGGGSALSSTSLAVALGKFRDQVDANGDPVYLSPACLIVPPALESVALALMNSTENVIAGDTDTVLPSGNSFRGLAEVVVSPYLSTAAGLTGASNTGWYLTAAPGDFAIAEVATLNGQTMPTIETAELNFDRLGMSWRAYHDFGVSLLEHRGGVLSAGA